MPYFVDENEVLGALGPKISSKVMSVGPSGQWRGAPNTLAATGFNAAMANGGQAQLVYARPPLDSGPTQGNTSRIRSYLGFGTVTFAIGDAADKVLVIEPQESFRVGRLVADQNLTGVTNAVIPLLRRADIGTQPQSPSVEQAAPLIMFARDVTGGDLDWQIAYRGTKIQLTLGISAAPVGAAAVVSVGAYGEWIR